MHEFDTCCRRENSTFANLQLIRRQQSSNQPIVKIQFIRRQISPHQWRSSTSSPRPQFVPHRNRCSTRFVAWAMSLKTRSTAARHRTLQTRESLSPIWNKSTRKANRSPWSLLTITPPVSIWIWPALISLWLAIRLPWLYTATTPRCLLPWMKCLFIAGLWLVGLGGRFWSATCPLVPTNPAPFRLFSFCLLGVRWNDSHLDLFKI